MKIKVNCEYKSAPMMKMWCILVLECHKNESRSMFRVITRLKDKVCGGIRSITMIRNEMCVITYIDQAGCWETGITTSLNDKAGPGQCHKTTH